MGHCWKSKDEVMFFHRPVNMSVPELANQLELIYISSVQIHDIVWKTCRERWMMGQMERERERESGKSVLTTLLAAADEYHSCPSTRMALALNNPWNKRNNYFYLFLFVWACPTLWRVSWLLYGISTLFGSFNAKLNFKRFRLV